MFPNIDSYGCSGKMMYVKYAYIIREQAPTTINN